MEATPPRPDAPRPGAPPAGTPERAADPMQALLEPWMQWWRQAGALGYSNWNAAAFFYDPRQLRNAWLADLTRSMDVYLRSPAFLDWLRASLSLMARPTALASPNRLK
jgi:hypothetical protein